MKAPSFKRIIDRNLRRDGIVRGLIELPNGKIAVAVDSKITIYNPKDSNDNDEFQEDYNYVIQKMFIR